MWYLGICKSPRFRVRKEEEITSSATTIPPSIPPAQPILSFQTKARTHRGFISRNAHSPRAQICGIKTTIFKKNWANGWAMVFQVLEENTENYMSWRERCLIIPVRNTCINTKHRVATSQQPPSKMRIGKNNLSNFKKHSNTSPKKHNTENIDSHIGSFCKKTISNHSFPHELRVDT